MEHLRDFVVGWLRNADEWQLWCAALLAAASKLIGLFVVGKWACKRCGAALAAAPEHPAVAKVLAGLATAKAVRLTDAIEALESPGVLASLEHGELAGLMVEGLSVLALLDAGERRRIGRAALARLSACCREADAARAARDRRAKLDAEAERQRQRAALADQLANPGPCETARALPTGNVPILAHAPTHRIPAPPVASCLCGAGCGCDPCPCPRPSERKAK